MRKKLLVVVAAFALVLCMPAMAFAANSAFDKGTAESTSYVDSYTGNAFLMERDALNLTVGRDLYWVGDTLNARGLEVGGGTGGSALLAGGTLNVASSTIHGSLRAAGRPSTFLRRRWGTTSPLRVRMCLSHPTFLRAVCMLLVRMRVYREPTRVQLSQRAR